jgi:hypothetical protein
MSTLMTAFALTSRLGGAAPSFAGSSTSSRGRSRARTEGAGGVTEPAGTERRLRAARIASPSSARCTSYWCAIAAGTRIADGYCSVTHMRDWTKAGGRWR